METVHTAYADYIGTPVSEIAGKTDYDLHIKEVADLNLEQDRKALQNNEVCQHEEWATYPDGREVLMHTLKTPVRDQKRNTVAYLRLCRRELSIRILMVESYQLIPPLKECLALRLIKCRGKHLQIHAGK